MSKKKEKIECDFKLDTPCGGDVEYVKIFGGSCCLPICENHLQEHKEIMTLSANGYDVEEILNQTPEWRKKEYLTLQLSGLVSEDVEL